MQKNWIDNLVNEEELRKTPSPLSEASKEKSLSLSLQALKSQFSQYVSRFNQLKTPDSPSIHMYNLANCEQGFMLFRQGTRLLVSLDQPACLKFQILKKEQEELKQYLQASVEIFFDNPFASPRWRHQDLPGFVELDILSRHYMESFLRRSLL